MRVGFKNELGNDISIKVEPVKIAPECGGAVIVMRGPASTCSNTITMREAVELNKILTKFLKQGEVS